MTRPLFLALIGALLFGGVATAQTVSYPPFVPDQSIELQGLVFDNTATAVATANTGVLQVALSYGGNIRVSCPATGGQHTIWINTTLIAYSHTLLSRGPNCVIKPLTGTGSVLNTDTFNRIINGPSFVTSGVSASISGNVETLTWPSHGRAVGDAIWQRGTSGTTDGNCSGIFTVASVVDANTLTFVFPVTPASCSSGTLGVIAADTDIHLDGGIIDYNYSGGNSGTYTGLHAINFAGVRDFSITNIGVTNASKFLLDMAGVDHGIISGFSGYSTNSDGVKCYGPCTNNIWDGLRITGAGDDMFSFAPQELAAFSGYDYAGGGPVRGNVVRNEAGSTSGGSVLHIFASQGVFDIDNNLLQNITGYAAGAPIINLDGQTTATSTVRNLEIDGCLLGDNTTQACVNLGGGVNVDQLTINRCTIAAGIGGSSTVGCVEISGAGAVGSVVINSGKADFTPYSFPFVTLSGAGTIGTISENNGSFKGTTSNGLLLNRQGTATLTQALFQGNQITAAHGIVQDNTGLPTTYKFMNNYGGQLSGAYLPCGGATVTDTIIAQGNNFPSLSQGLVRTNCAGITANIYTSNNIIPSGDYLAKLNGSETINVHGTDFTVDVTTVARCVGCFLYNTNASAGTLTVVGGVVNDNTTGSNSWHLIWNPILATY